MNNEQMALKQRLLAECIRIQKDVVATAKKAMQEAQDSAIEYDESAEDNMVDSYREEMQNKRDMFARQVEAAIDDMALLNKVRPDLPLDTASFGAVVITEAQSIFVAISLGSIKLEEKTFVSVSPSAPLYKAVAGKKAGETFKFRDKDIKVLEVY
jgi:hypothetical protein